MENNYNQLNDVIGFNANNDGACFEFLFNKLFENNEKQLTVATDVDFSIELNNSSLLDNIYNNEISFAKKSENTTYTLEDLLGFASDIPCPETNNEAFDLLTGEPQQQQYAEVIFDTALASPLSASSEESCCLDDLLFNDEVPVQDETTTDTPDFSNNELVQNDPLEQIMQLSNSTFGDSLNLSVQGNLLENESNTNNDFNTLQLLLLQNEVLNQESLETSLDLPASPSQSDSDSDIRYTPYKKSRKQKTPEQRQRKKAQNRNAAVRYRVKKKDEFQAMNAEADELEEKNKELKGKVEGLRTEIDYLKNLMLDVIKARLAKGNLPSDVLSLIAMPK